MKMKRFLISSKKKKKREDSFCLELALHASPTPIISNSKQVNYIFTSPPKLSFTLPRHIFWSHLLFTLKWPSESPQDLCKLSSIAINRSLCTSFVQYFIHRMSWFYHQAQKWWERVNHPSKAIRISMCDHLFVFLSILMSIWPILWSDLSALFTSTSPSMLPPMLTWISIHTDQSEGKQTNKKHWDLINPTDWRFKLTSWLDVLDCTRFRSVTQVCWLWKELRKNLIFSVKIDKSAITMCAQWVTRKRVEYVFRITFPCFSEQVMWQARWVDILLTHIFKSTGIEPSRRQLLSGTPAPPLDMQNVERHRINSICQFVCLSLCMWGFLFNRVKHKERRVLNSRSGF